MEVYRPNIGEELADRRQFLKKLALGAGAVGMAVIVGDTIRLIEKGKQREICEVYRKREHECIKQLYGGGTCNPETPAEDVKKVTQIEEHYNKAIRTQLLFGASTEAGIAVVAFRDKIVDKDSDIAAKKRQ